MLNFFKSYPYFNLSILLLFMVFIIFLFSSRNRSYILFSGILSVPFAFSSLLFIPEYWDPVRIMGTVISIEDVIFSFSTGCMACWITTLLKKKKITFDFAPILILKRYLIISHFCFLLTIVLNSAGMGIMTAIIIVISLLGLVFLYFFWDFRTLILTGAVLFSLLYGAVLFIAASLFPRFSMQWSQMNLTEIQLFGFPVEEILWAFTFGAVWPVFVMYVTGMKLKDNR